MLAVAGKKTGLIMVTIRKWDTSEQVVCKIGRADRLLAYIPPGFPWSNGYVESFNSRIRDKCLNINSFYSLLHARVVISNWKHEYNTVRRHSALRYLTPADYARPYTHEMKPVTHIPTGPKNGEAQCHFQPCKTSSGRISRTGD